MGIDKLVNQHAITAKFVVLSRYRCETDSDRISNTYLESKNLSK